MTIIVLGLQIQVVLKVHTISVVLSGNKHLLVLAKIVLLHSQLCQEMDNKNLMDGVIMLEM
jgi:hypothetical protein